MLLHLWKKAVLVSVAVRMSVKCVNVISCLITNCFIIYCIMFAHILCLCYASHKCVFIVPAMATGVEDQLYSHVSGHQRHWECIETISRDPGPDQDKAMFMLSGEFSRSRIKLRSTLSRGTSKENEI